MSLKNQVETTDIADASLTLNDAMVGAYLIKHPLFFQDNPAVLSTLELQHDTGAAISLVARQVSTLRDLNRELQQHLERLLDIARDNDLLFSKIRALTLQLISCVDNAQTIQILADSLRKDFQLEFCQLILFEPQTDTNAIIRHDTLESAQERIPSLLRTASICGLLRLDELDYLFGAQGSLIGSASVLHLRHQRSIGLLAIGHREREHFRSSMDTLFINYLGDVLVRLLEKNS